MHKTCIIYDSKYYLSAGFLRSVVLPLCCPYLPQPLTTGLLIPSLCPTLHKNLNYHLVGYKIKSRSSYPGSGDTAKDARLPRAPPSCCPSSHCQPDLGFCSCQGQLGQPSMLRTPSASLQHLPLATSLDSALALPGSLHLLRLGCTVPASCFWLGKTSWLSVRGGQMCL